MLSDYDEPYRVYHHNNDDYKINVFNALDEEVFPEGVFTVEEYYVNDGDWDIARGSTHYKTFEEADNYIQKKDYR